MFRIRDSWEKRAPSCFSVTLGLTALVALVISCAPGQTRSVVGPASQLAAPGPPRVLTLGIQREPRTLVSFSGTGSRTGGAQNPRFITHNRLTEPDARGVPQPQVAEARPSITAGTWKLNSDGSMDTTWRLRSDVKWHDGTPFSSADMLFTFELKKDPDLCCAPGRPELMASAAAPDSSTFVVHWSGTYVDADQALEIEPAPRHILEDAYRNHKESFMNSPWLSTEFVGLGPYRLTRWEPGSHMSSAGLMSTFWADHR